MTVPVMPAASGLDKKAAGFPTSSACNGSVSGDFSAQYSTILSMMPIALAARDASDPAEIAFNASCHSFDPEVARLLVSFVRAILFRRVGEGVERGVEWIDLLELKQLSAG